MTAFELQPIFRHYLSNNRISQFKGPLAERFNLRSVPQILRTSSTASWSWFLASYGLWFCIIRSPCPCGTATMAKTRVPLRSRDWCTGSSRKSQICRLRISPPIGTMDVRWARSLMRLHQVSARTGRIGTRRTPSRTRPRRWAWLMIGSISLRFVALIIYCLRYIYIYIYIYMKFLETKCSTSDLIEYAIFYSSINEPIVNCYLVFVAAH